MTWHPVVNEWNTWEVWFRFYLFHPFHMIPNFLVEKCSSWYWEAGCLPPTSVFPRICRSHLTSLAIHHNRQQTYLARSKKGLNFSARPSKHISGWSYMQDSGVRKFLGSVSVLKEILKAKDGFLILQVLFYWFSAWCNCKFANEFLKARISQQLIFVIIQ